MRNLLGKLFGQTEQKTDEQQTVPVAASKYDPEYVEYCIELEQVVSALEENLHTSDDPQEIAMQTLKVAGSFYGGDWAGIIDVDLDLDVWTPLWWYNIDTHDKTRQLTTDYELAKNMPTWVNSLRNGTPILVPDVKELQTVFPEEFAVYERLQIKSIIGVPFGPNPVGLLAIRNPTRYVTHPSMMSILAYVLHRAMAQQKTIESSRLTISPDEIHTDRDIIINFFGSMEICTQKGVLRERDLNSPKSSRVATYLMLNRKSAHSPYEIVEALWPETPDKWETLSSYIRGYIHTFRKAFALVSDKPLIESTANGYQISHDFHIMTDLQHFDMLWEQAQHAVTVAHKIDILKQAAALYKGHVFENACDEHWILGTVTHYKMRYIGIINELLSTLNDAGDYKTVQQYATRAIELTPENVKAHYWLIRAMTMLGTSELARNQVIHARQNLTEEEYESLKDYILADKEIPYSLLFRED